jgi:hypothetical protein
MGEPVPPFEVRALRPATVDHTSVPEQPSYSALLPATTRTKRDDIVVPRPDVDFLHKELRVKRLDDLQGWLWACGRPMPPRPLHHQRLLGREIHVTEDPELHLVWWRNRIFVKPLPAFLLDPDFWREHLVDSAGWRGRRDAGQVSLEASARGMLFSYTALVAYESDFRIAREAGLISSAVTWTGWKALAAEFLGSHSYDRVSPRYWYGELRLSRLNRIYRLRKGYLLRGYSRVVSHAFYGSFVEDNLAILGGILAYVIIVLTAMQVGTGVDELAQDDVFQRASYGFTIFAMIAPLVGIVIIFGIVIAMVVSNWRVTKSYEKKRFHEMGVEPLGSEKRLKNCTLDRSS